MKVMLDPNAFMPERAHPEDAGLDLRTPVAVTIPPALPGHSRSFFPTVQTTSCCAAIDTGVHLKIPHGCIARIEGKEALNQDHQIVCFGDVIDENHCGPIVVMLYNLGDKPYTFQRGDTIAQLIVQRVLKAELELVFENTLRILPDQIPEGSKLLDKLAFVAYNGNKQDEDARYEG